MTVKQIARTCLLYQTEKRSLPEVERDTELPRHEVVYILYLNHISRRPHDTEEPERKTSSRIDDESDSPPPAYDAENSNDLED